MLTKVEKISKMRKIKFLSILAIMLFFGTSAFAQTGKLKRAKAHMDNLEYLEAIHLYNRILEGNDVAEAKINLADCYRKIDDTENAEFWYGQVVRLPEVQPIHKLYYGQVLQANGKCDLAKDWYQQYITAAPEDIRGNYLAKSCDYQEELMTKNTGIYEVEHMDFNSNLDDFSPTFYNGGIIFASERDKGSAVKRIHTWTGQPFNELYYIDAKEKKSSDVACTFEYGTPKKFSKSINTKFHEAGVTFTKDESRMYFTRNNYNNGKRKHSDEGITKLKIYTAIGGDGKWGKTEELPFNSDEYSCAHPTLDADGKKLYFASDMPGGFGGMDLYVTEREGESWGPPINLGPRVNTEGNEIFPHFSNEKLFFSSDGHIGLGGLDIYFMNKQDGGEWSLPENIGSPINSTEDDFSLIMNEEGTCGYFASDKKGGSGRDDIYSFRKVASPVHIFVYDAETGEGIEGAKVLNSCTGQTLTTNAEGKTQIDMKLDMCCTFDAKKEEYDDNGKEGCTKDIKMGDPVFVEIPLEKEKQFDVEGIVFDQSTGLPLDGATVTLVSSCDTVKPQTYTTDLTGKYHFDLSNDCCYTVKGEKIDYLAASSDEFCTKGLKENKTFNENLNLMPTKSGIASTDGDVYYDPVTGKYVDRKSGNPAAGTYPNGMVYKDGTMYVNDEPYSHVPAFQTGPGTVADGEPIPYLVDIYYDFNQSYIRDEATPELDKVFSMMNDNPNAILEVSSYTDSRGSDSYNDGLSRRRAKSVVKWLIKKGIPKTRITAKGYGENNLVNNCVDLKPCSEEEHQLNRRTEFKVIGFLGDNQDILSQPKANPKVDPCKNCPF